MIGRFAGCGCCGVGALGAVALFGAACASPKTPVLDAYASHVYAESQPVRREHQLTATFLGTSTVLLSDGETAILTDGFVTRPARSQLLFGKIKSDPSLVRRALDRVGVHKIAAVMPVHSHHDHAMDAPEVARQTGALLVGSESTANIGRGWGLPEARIHVVHAPETMQFGKFEVTWIETVHTPMTPLVHWLTGIGDTIESPLKQPARTWAFNEGGCYTIYVRHPWGNVLIQGGTGFVPGALKAVKADVVFLGIAQLGKMSADYRESYFHELVEETGATRIIPVHWDDFTVPLDEPLRPLGGPLDDFPAGMDFLIEKAGTQRSVVVMPAWTTMALYPEH